MLEDFIRESRMVMLGFYVDDPKIKQRANDIIENKVAITATEAGGNVSINALRAKTVDAYYEMGTRYFKRYAIMNWTIFLTPNSRQRLENIKSEIVVIDEVIYQVQHETRFNDRTAMLELGQYLFSKVRLERLLDNAETEMINMIESPIFKERLLPDVVRYFYNASRKR
jgi:hypothetical protein